MKKTLFALVACLAALRLAPVALAIDLPETADEVEAFPLDEQTLERYVPPLQVVAFERTEDGKTVVTFDSDPKAGDFVDLGAQPVAEKRTTVELRISGLESPRVEGEASPDALTYAFALDADVETADLYVSVYRSARGLPELAAAGAHGFQVWDRYGASGDLQGRDIHITRDDGTTVSWFYAVWDGQLKLKSYACGSAEGDEELGEAYYAVAFSPADGRMCDYSYLTFVSEDQTGFPSFLARRYTPGGELLSAFYHDAASGNNLIWDADLDAWMTANGGGAHIETLPDGMPENPEELKPPFTLAGSDVAR